MVWIDENDSNYSLLERIQHLYWRIIPYDYRPKEIWYRLKCFLWHRYTTIHPKTLPWHTWTDRSTLLPHCIFGILVDFIDGECSPGWVDWEASGHTIMVDGIEKNVRQEMQDLYNWWKNVDQEKCSEVYDRDLAKEHEETWAKIDKLGRHSFKENEGGYYQLYSEYDSDEDEKLRSKLISRVIEIEEEDSAILIRNMQRVCACQPYMWT